MLAGFAAISGGAQDFDEKEEAEGGGEAGSNGAIVLTSSLAQSSLRNPPWLHHPYIILGTIILTSSLAHHYYINPWHHHPCVILGTILASSLTGEGEASSTGAMP